MVASVVGCTKSVAVAEPLPLETHKMLLGLDQIQGVVGKTFGLPLLVDLHLAVMIPFANLDGIDLVFQGDDGRVDLGQ